MLHGRRAECEALERLLADARRSRSGVLVVRGEAGVGKSALLGHAAGRADGMAVLRASGVESEAELPFAALHQLLRPVLGLVGRLPAPQAAALAGALGLGTPGDDWGPGGPLEGGDRFLISVAVLSLLAEVAEDRPVLCLIDEAQWLDRSSAQALTFTARLEQAFGEQVRRLPTEARTILLVAAADTDGDPTVVLRAAARLGVGPDALEEAESAGLVRTGGGRLEFRHPLVRSAAYQVATLAARQAAHRALATAWSCCTRT
jgi:AAA ATPase domain